MLTCPVTSQNEKTTLLGKTKQDYASILRWLSFANSELLPRFGGWYRPLMGRDAYNKKNVDDASKAALKNMSVLEKHFTANTYLVGERITLADFFTAALLTRAFATVLDQSFRSDNPAVTRWYSTVTNQPAFKAVVEKPVLIEKAIQYTPPKKEEKKEKKEEKKEEKPAEPKPEKPKHPLEALGKPNFPIDDWKRFYSNEDTRPTALNYFWENYNPEEYSIWKVQFKYNNELTLTFMANNLIGMLPDRDCILSLTMLQVVSRPVSRLLASTCSAPTLCTVPTTTASPAVSTWSAARTSSRRSRSPLTGRATTSPSLTRPTTARRSRTCWPGTPLSSSTARSTPGLTATFSSKESSVCR